MGYYHLSIGTATNRVNLLMMDSGAHVNDWTPNAIDHEGIFGNTPLADGRQLRHYRNLTVIDTFDMVIDGLTHNQVIRTTQDLRRICRDALDYWVNRFNNDPVYLQAQASCETNVRYALVHDARLPNDDNPYGQPFQNIAGRPAMVDMPLLVEHGPWLANVPGTGECVETSAYQNLCYPSHLEFDGDISVVTVGSPAKLDDLPDFAVAGKGQITVEAWVRPDGWGDANQGMIASKTSLGASGWAMHFLIGLTVRIWCAGQQARSDTGFDDFTNDGLWHHVLFVYDETGAGTPAARTIYIAIDGVWVTTYSTQQVSIGNYNSDAVRSLLVGNYAALRGWDGGIGWVRISDNIRYDPAGGDFTPPARCIIPQEDANTMWLGIKEGEGATVYDLSNVAVVTNGTATNCTWDCDCSKLFGSVTGECGPAFLEFNATTSVVTVPDKNQLQDLPDAGATSGTITVDGWIRADGYGEGNAGRIVDKLGVLFYVNNAVGLVGTIAHAVQAAISTSGLDEFTADSSWHHVLMTYNDTTDQLVYLAIDGTWVVSYPTQQSPIGAYTSDVGTALSIGNNAAQTTTFDGDIGWIRVSDSIRYPVGVNFVAPARCTLPTADANTVWLGIWEGVGTRTYDLSGYDNYGTLSSATWDCDCITGGVVSDPTCEDEVYVANKQNMAQITDVYWYDASAGTWSANLIGAAKPQPLLPPVPAANDLIVFGIDTTTMDSGPFCSLVFDLSTAQIDLTNINWKYWNGGWAALTVQDNTDADGLMTGNAFDTTGVKSVHWEQPTDWVAVSLAASIGAGAPPITGYWVRARVTAVGGAPAPPIQQNRDIYTVTWPFVEVEADQVAGDIPALLEAKFRNQSDRDREIGWPRLLENRVLVGLRSVSRGADFVAYWNCSDEQNPAFMTCAVSGVGAFANDVDTPTGRKVTATNPGAAWSSVCYWTISSDYADQFIGEYHAFIRGEQTAGAKGDLQVRLRISVAGLTTYTYSEIYSPTAAGQEVWDFGRITLPGTDVLLAEDTFELRVDVQMYGNAVADADIDDLVLLPVDEWALDSFDPEYSASGAVGARGTASSDYLHVDSVNNPKVPIRTIVKDFDAETVSGIYVPISNGPAIAQHNALQRYWFFCIRSSSADFAESKYEIVNTNRMLGIDRYLSMRGDR